MKKQLLRVSTPGRYVGGEYGTIIKDHNRLSIALCFPDLYEIGMSNQAVRILYNLINKSTGASCERVFSPAPDMDEMLKGQGIPLFSLESGRPVREHDILAFTVGYELSATNILNILDLSRIPIKNSDRSNEDPVVIAGGPAITNPIPFGNYIDAVYIGEAEDVFIATVEKLSKMKAAGASRDDIIETIKSADHFWFKNKESKTATAVWQGFGKGASDYCRPVPSVRTIQDHGVVEIMRGCPNGCRFCHAGMYYRPYREKSIERIIDEVDLLIKTGGYREVTLSSLSSGDYSNIKELVEILNKRYSNRNISFSFPSMRVNNFTLPLISEISKVRKSGLTFAVETPDLFHQRGLNKEAPLEKILEILSEARKMGWNKAKFYFMTGLPFFEHEDETTAIIDFLNEAGRKSKMQLNVNIGTFIPKPHTPFQWSFQLSEQQALDRMLKIKRALPARYFKVGFQSPLISYIEGIISRGDERAGDLIEEAYRKGAVLDAWEEYLRKDIWHEVIEAADWNVEKETCSGKDIDYKFPWDGITLNAGKKYLRSEYDKAFKGELTSACTEECDHQCGACGPERSVISYNEKAEVQSAQSEHSNDTREHKKILFTYTKFEKASFLSHINIMTVFERALLRAEMDVRYTEGFNPKPKLEFANPLPLGMESAEEAAAVEVNVELSQSGNNYKEFLGSFIEKMNKSLPQGLNITNAKIIKTIESEETGKKTKSLMSVYGGSLYEVICTGDEAIKKLKTGLDNNKLKYEVKDHEDENKSVLLVKNIAAADGKVFNFIKYIKNDLNNDFPFDFYDFKRIHNYCRLNPQDGLSSYFDFFN